MGDWEATADAERLGSDFQARCGLLALVFVAVDFVDDVADQLERKMERIGDLLRRVVVFDIAAQNREGRASY